MTVKGIHGGTRFRHLAGDDLKGLEDSIEKLPYKVEPVGVTFRGSTWYIHFMISDLTAEPLTVSKREIAKPTQTKNARGKK